MAAAAVMALAAASAGQVNAQGFGGGRPAIGAISAIDKAGKEKPLEHQWYAQVKIVESSHLLRPGMTGRVKVKCGMQTIGRVLGQTLLDSINLDYRL